MLLQFSVVFPAEPRWTEGRGGQGVCAQLLLGLESTGAAPRLGAVLSVGKPVQRGRAEGEGCRGHVGWDGEVQVRPKADVVTSVGSGGRRAGSGRQRGRAEGVFGKEGPN